MPPCKQQRTLPRDCHGSVVLLRLTPQRRAWGSRSPPLQSDGRCKATQCNFSAAKMKSENRRRTCGIRQASATLSSLPTANVSAVSHANASSPAKPFRMTSDAHSLLSTPRSFNLPQSSAARVTRVRAGRLGGGAHCCSRARFCSGWMPELMHSENWRTRPRNKVCRAPMLSERFGRRAGARSARLLA